MPKLTVRLYASLRDAAQTARIEAEGETLPQILDDLKQKTGPAFRTALFDEKGTVRPGFQLLLGMTYLDPKKLASIAIRDGDTLHVMPPIAGG